MSDFNPKPVPTVLQGLQKVCRAFGKAKFGDTMVHWDFYEEEPVKAAEFTPARRKLSEKAKYEKLRALRTNDTKPNPTPDTADQ